MLKLLLTVGRELLVLKSYCAALSRQEEAPGLDASWLPVYELEQQHVDFIVAFVSSPEKEESQKMQFLRSICKVCNTSRAPGMSKGLDLFCQRYELAENIKMLLEEERSGQMWMAVQQHAMLAIAKLSTVEGVLEGKEKSLLQVCFCSIFLAPPKEEMQGLSHDLYPVTMQTMDIMLKKLMLGCRVSRVSEMLQDIFQMLLTFTKSRKASVRERAIGRMTMLSHLLANLLKADPNGDRQASYAEIQLPILGQLLGHLILLLSFKEEETSRLALDILCSLFQFKHQQRCATLPEENAQLQGDWKAKTTALRSSPSVAHITEAFEEYLQPPERTDVVLVFIEAMRDASSFDKEAARNALGMVMGHPELWLADVPKITTCIHQNLECINMDSARQSMESLLLLMAEENPGEVVRTLLKIAPPGDSTALDMWEAMFSVPQTLHNVLRELHIQLQDRRYRVLSTPLEDISILRLALLASSDLEEEEFAPMYLAGRFLRQRRPAMLSLVLSGIMTLSEKEEMARKMLVLLPDLRRVLFFGYKAVTMKALVVFRHLMAQLEREKASPIAVQLAEFVLPFFDDELSQMRESSISLFRDLMKMVVENHKRQMKSIAQASLLPLFFHMSDQVRSVAKLKQDRRRAKEFLNRSRPYLKNEQASLREAAVRFIDASWLPVYELEQQHVDFIVAFVSSPEKEESQKMQFLRSICKVCNTSRAPGMSKGLDLFCQRYELAENIKMLLEEERSGQMWMAVQQHTMLAIAKLSTVEGVLEGKEKSLLQVCFCSIFLAPPKEEMQGLSHDLYPVTMQTMDIMLKKLMLGCRVSRVSEMLQDIFQMLLTFTKSRKASVRERAIGRMTMLSHLLANLLKADPNGDRQASYTEIQLPILGQLLGHLILLLSFKEEETSRLALDILCSLLQFKHQQRCATLPEENAQLQGDWKAKTTALRSSPSVAHITEAFEEYLQPPERTDVVLVFIEAMRDASSFDKEAARNALGMVMGHPELWLADVPKIMTCIHQNLECINMDSARQSMESLLLLMAEENPGEVVRTLLKIAPPGDSTALDMWEAMFSVPQTLHNVLRELHIQLQDRRYRVLSTPLEDISILRLALLASSDLEEEEFAPMYLAGRFLRQRRPAMLSLVLSGIMTLSEKEEMARKMLVLLPDLRRVLFFGYKAVTMKALVVFRHLLAQLEREKASPIAVQLAEFVLPFFDDELSQMRESSISLFRDLMKMVVENHKRQMKSIAQASLLPLFFHMSDQVRSVAKLKQDRRRAKEFLNRSRPYLKNEQASLREAAVRFIDASWLPVYELEQQHVDFIVAFVSSPEKEESQKMQFLRSICKVCNTSRAPGMSKGLDLFCQRYELAENIKMLLEEERSGQMWMAVQQHAMLAIAKLSTVEGVLEGKEKSLLQVCFCSIFLAPPKEEMQGLSHDLYPVTMQTMDIMLKKLMLGCRVSRVSEMLQDIFQMLLTFTKSRKASVRERAIGRMTMLSHLLANLLKADPNGDRQASYAEIQLPILGQLLGHLILLLSFKEEETSRLALDILCSLFQFKHQQRCATLPEENAQLQGDWKAKTTALRSSPSVAHITEAFEEYLQPPERTDVVLVFIEAMRDASSFDKEAARNALGMVMGHPELWLADVPKITTCIHQNLECINMDSARQSMESLLLLMAEENPGEVVRTLLKIAPPGDSTALDMWEAMFSVPQTLHNVLRELHIQLQDRRYRVLSTPLEDISILRLALLASSDLEEEEFAPMYLAGRFLRQRRPAMLSLVLSGIMTLSEKEEMARKMLVLLPDLRRVLFFGYKAVTMKALVVFRHLLAQLEREKASPIAVQLAEFVLPFFDDELSQMRESSISLFRDLMKMVVENHKRQMKGIAQASLLPLFFHMSDQVWSVAKLKQDRRRAKEFLNRSRPYLKNEQASLREAAVRFIDASWLPVYELEQQHVDFIVAFVSSPEKEESQKMQFLRSICKVCNTSRAPGMSKGLDLFCQRYELAENIKMLLEEERSGQMWMAVQQHAMLAIAKLSTVEGVLEGKEKSLLQVCFCSIFLAPPKEEMQGLSHDLYPVTMQTMDIMLKKLMLGCRVSRVSEMLQDIFQMLLTFTKSRKASVRERAIGRMTMLSHLLANLLKADPNGDRQASYAEIQLPILGQLLGHLILLLSFKEEETSRLALDILCSLFQFKHQQRCATLPEENAQLQGDWKAKTTALRSSPSVAHITEAFEEYLQPPERTDVVLVFIEAMRDASSFDKEAARNALGMVMGHPELWLADVPKITTCIHQNLECINMDSARQSMESLLLLMAEENPGEVVRTLLKIAPPGDSTALDMWEAMFSVPQTLHNVLRELHIQLQDRRYRVLSTPLEDISILRLALLASSDLEEEEFAPMYLAGRFLRQRRPAMLSLVLSGIMTLSEKEEMARKMLVLLPDLRRVLFFGYKAVTMKALVVFRHLLAQLEREKASPIAVQLAEFVLPFFDDELSQMRESSISLFRDLMKMVVENHKRQMKSIAQASLLPLFFHMSDQVRSVAKLKQDRRRAKEFLNRSRPYLKNEQASLREAAVRFIGEQNVTVPVDGEVWVYSDRTRIQGAPVSHLPTSALDTDAKAMLTGSDPLDMYMADLIRGLKLKAISNTAKPQTFVPVLGIATEVWLLWKWQMFIYPATSTFSTVIIHNDPCSDKWSMTLVQGELQQSYRVAHYSSQW
ncbi:hypothetical protein Q9966_000490 [Columba livia]|nr:hypothetical protein Q9966_000490 [Columba livia]